ncbi:MAG: DUF4388 domain-containing protein [Caldisericia bacterium]|nr:DUF4388 domain-containing protein [Caldisericia bacterium]
MGVEGNIRDFPLVDVFNLLSFGAKTGILKINGKKNREDLNGEIYFLNGKIVDAKSGVKNGEEAFYDIFLIDEGNFSFSVKDFKREKTIEKNLDALLLEGIRRADELKGLQSKLPNLDSFLETNPKVNATEIKLSSDEWQILNLFRDKRTIRDALKISTFSEFVTLRTIYLLLTLNLLKTTEEEKIDISKIIPKKVISPVKDTLSILGLSGPKTICDRVLFKIDGSKSLQDIALELRLSDKEILSCFIKLLKETKILANISLDKLKLIEKLTKEE